MKVYGLELTECYRSNEIIDNMLYRTYEKALSKLKELSKQAKPYSKDPLWEIMLDADNIGSFYLRDRETKGSLQLINIIELDVTDEGNDLSEPEEDELIYCSVCGFTNCQCPCSPSTK